MSLTTNKMPCENESTDVHGYANSKGITVKRLLEFIKAYNVPMNSRISFQAAPAQVGKRKEPIDKDTYTYARHIISILDSHPVLTIGYDIQAKE